MQSARNKSMTQDLHFDLNFDYITNKCKYLCTVHAGATGYELNKYYTGLSAIT